MMLLAWNKKWRSVRRFRRPCRLRLRAEALNPIAERAAKAQASIQRLSATSDANIEEAPNDEEFPAGGKDKNALEPILLKFS